MANVPCPRCNEPNLRPPGAAGTYCQGCGHYFQFEPQNFFDRLIEPFSSPKGIVIGSVALLFLFAAFWGLLHLSLSRPAQQNPTPAQVATNDTTANTSATPPPSEPPPPPPVTAPEIRVPTPSPIATAPTAPQRVAGPVPQPLPMPVSLMNDKQVGETISRGAHCLINGFDPVTHAIPADATIMHGVNALAIYALLQCNDAIDDPELNPTSAVMAPAIDTLKSQPLDRTVETYGRSLRANALALLDRPVDRPVIQSDVEWLLSACRGGAYSYTMPPANLHPDKSYGDNSNSQYGLLGVWAGTEVGIPVPSSYWLEVQKHWIACQNADGSMGYTLGEGGRLSMTAAGVASLYIAHDFLAQSTPVGVDSRSPELLKALAWMNAGDRAITIGGAYVAHFSSYALYSVARAGLASGYKYFGKHDWYTELGADAIRGQHADGSFGDTIDSSFTLLFLARGRHPIMFNKLNVEGVAIDHPRDFSNLARYASRELEHTFNAQLVPISEDWTAWMDAPVLYLAASSAPALTDEQCDQLRSYVRAGGLLFTHADGNSRAFNAFSQDLAQRLFPEYAYQDVPADHPIYSDLFKLNPRPPLKAVSNGARLLMVNSPQDLARSWDIHDWQKVEPAYRLGLNLFLYAAGKSDFRNRLDTPCIAAPLAKAAVTVNVARLRYAGNWDPEPYAWTRFARDFQWKTSFAVDAEPTDIKDLNPQQTPIADLTGTDAHQFAPTEINAMRNFVQQGGVLLIDSCGGMPGFASTQTELLAALSPGATPTLISPTHPLLNGNGPCMDKLPRALSRIPGPDLVAPEIISLGRGHIIITPLDITNALLDCRALGMSGYSARYALPFVKNILLWAYSGQPDQ
jgi:hypothetical protein